MWPLMRDFRCGVLDVSGPERTPAAPAEALRHGGRRVREAVPGVSTTLPYPMSRYPAPQWQGAIRLPCWDEEAPKRHPVIDTVSGPDRHDPAFRAPSQLNMRTQKPFGGDLDIDNLRWTPIVGQPEPLVKVYPRGFRCRLRSPLRRWLLYLQNPFDQSFCSRWCLCGCGRRRAFPRFPSWLGKRGKRSRSATPIVHISRGRPGKFAAARDSRGSVR